MASDQPPNNTRPVVCVFCGACPGTSPAHLDSARALAAALHAANAKLVYGGGTTGLMGAVASALVALSGPDAVTGVIPRALVAWEAPTATATQGKSDAEIAAQIDPAVFGRTEVVQTMHARKARMCALVAAGGRGSGFVALAGGFGTLEELMEMTTWNQLGIHALPIVLFNVAGYWDGLIKWRRDSVEAGFVRQDNSEILKVETEAEAVVAALAQYTASNGRFNLDWKQS